MALFQAEIEYLWSEPIADWRQTEQNLKILWIKAKGYYTIKSTVFSPNDNAFKKAKNEPVYNKLIFLKNEKIIQNSTYEFLNKARKRRNKVHPPNRFSKQDYIMFREAKTLTDILFLHAVRNVKDDIWRNVMASIEEHAKILLEKFQLN